MLTAVQTIESGNEPYTLDEIDRQLILLTQSGLPLTAQPYVALAEQLGISEAQVLQRMQVMLHTGLIRRVGAVPNHYRLGYRANGMSVWDVEDDRLIDLGQQVGQLGFVTHCYQRPRHLPHWPYNLFAMVHAHTRDEAMAFVAHIQELLGDACHGHDVLFSSRILKKTGLRIG